MPSMLHKKSNLAYLHLSKTGGWYVSHILKKLGFQNINMNYNGGHVGVKHLPKDTYTFGFVRHPVSWYRSLFNFFYNTNWDHRSDIFKSEDINEFLLKIQQYKIYEYQSYYDDFYGINTNSECNFIGRYELLNQDLKRVLCAHAAALDVDRSYICKIIDVNRNCIINKSTTFHNDQITNDNIQLIYDTCKNIFDQYNYEV